MRLILLGGPGSGKGTQAQKLSQQFSVPWISTGEVLRAEVDAGSDLGKKVETLLASGELVPDEMMIAFVKKRLQAVDAAKGWVLDGYPRTAFQAEELDFFLDSVQQAVDYAVWLEVPAHV
ncbi:MAG: nucleoside monophosphate kinase, partial [Cyanobacteria bacterium P01_D01_bin.44]